MKSFFSAFSESIRNMKDLRTLTTTGILLALAICIKSFTIQVTPDIWITFSFIPICVIGMLFGPVPCAMSNFLLDFIGYLIVNKSARAYSPQLSLVVIIAGLIYGAILYKCDFRNHPVISVIKAVLSRLSVVVFCNMILNSYFLYTLYVNKDFSLFSMTKDSALSFVTYCLPRITKNAVQFPVDAILLSALLPVFQTAYIKIRSQFSVSNRKAV